MSERLRGYFEESRRRTEAVLALGDQGSGAVPGALAGILPESPYRRGNEPGAEWREAALGLPDFDPLKGALLRWIEVLIDDRINRAALDACDLAFVGERQLPVSPFTEPTSLHAMRRVALAASATAAVSEGNAALARAAWAAVQERSAGYCDLRQRLWERRVELGERLELVAPRARLLPAYQDGTEPEVSLDAGLNSLATAILKRTDDLAAEVIAPGTSGFFSAVLSTQGGDAWPAQLTPASMIELLGCAKLLRHLQLRPFRLPQRLAPVSFHRAALRLGAAMREAAAPGELPFVVRRDPMDVAGQRFGATLALWMLSEVFLKKRLGLSRDAQIEAKRALARSLLGHLRLTAARALVDAESEPGKKRALSWEMASRVVGEDLPLPGLWSAQGAGRGALLGLVLGASDLCQLSEVHDEDFPDNPRAQDQIRTDLSRPAATSVSSAELDRGLEFLLSAAQSAAP